MVSVLSAPASAFGPPLIGVLLSHTGDFSLPFGALVPVGVVALIAALVAGTIVARTRMGEDLLRLGERDPDDFLPRALASGSRVALPASALPSIVTLGALAPGGAPIIQQLQHAGGLPLVLPRTPAPAHGEAADLLTEEAFFRETFDQHIWPLFCQLLFGRTQGMCLIEENQGAEGMNGARVIDTEDLQREAPDPWSAMLQRYLTLLAWLVGMPVLGAGWELQSLQLNQRTNERKGPETGHLWPLPANLMACGGDSEELPAYSQFVAACAAYTPPSPEDLTPSTTRSATGCAGVTRRSSASCTGSRWHVGRGQRRCLRSSHRPTPGSQSGRRRPMRSWVGCRGNEVLVLSSLALRAISPGCIAPRHDNVH